MPSHKVVAQCKKKEQEEKKLKRDVVVQLQYYCRKETGLEDVGDAFTNNPATRTAHSKQQHRREISCSNVSRYSHCRHLELGWGEVSKSTCFFGIIFKPKNLSVRFFSIYSSYAALQLIGLDSK